ncbi:MAG: rhodanese-like domain-containing protein [Gammaproteobacteria bacterium]|nr:rhodanese-like domain-containing protein [Gammaproteobacteria bacterium]
MAQMLEFLGNHAFLATAAGVIIALIIANEIKLRNRGFKDIDPTEAIRLMNDGALVLDMRNPELYRAGHIINAENVTLEQLQQDSGKILKDTDKPVIAYCDAGMIGSRAALLLSRAHKSGVYNLKGGMTNWKRENLPVSRD